MNDCQDGMAKFTSLVRAGDNSPGESWGQFSLVRVLVNDCHSDVSPVNNSDSDSGAFGYFLQTINWSPHVPVDRSAQQVSKNNTNDTISLDTMH